MYYNTNFNKVVNKSAIAGNFMQNKLSVIVPVYNVERYLKKCIHSILNQTLTDLELILVDDGSTDKSGSICDEFDGHDDRVTVIHINNGGPANARNTALKMASGKYIGFVDSDDWIEPRMYETLCRQAEQTSSDLVFCDYVTETTSSSVNQKSYYGTQDVFDRNDINNLFLPYFFGYTDDELKSYMMCCPFADFRSYNWLCVFMSAVINEYNLSFKSEKQYFNEDNLFNLDFIFHANVISHVPDYFYHYRCNSGSISKTFNSRYLETKLDKFSFLRSFIMGNNLDDDFLKRLNNRLCVETVSILNYYAGSKQLKLREKRASVAMIARSQQVAAALSGVDLKRLRFSKVKVYLRLLKLKAYWLIVIMSSVYSLLFKR